MQVKCHTREARRKIHQFVQSLRLNATQRRRDAMMLHAARSSTQGVLEMDTHVCKCSRAGTVPVSPDPLPQDADLFLGGELARATWRVRRINLRAAFSAGAGEVPSTLAGSSLTGHLSSVPRRLAQAKRGTSAETIA